MGKKAHGPTAGVPHPWAPPGRRHLKTQQRQRGPHKTPPAQPLLLVSVQWAILPGSKSTKHSLVNALLSSPSSGSSRFPKAAQQPATLLLCIPGRGSGLQVSRRLGGADFLLRAEFSWHREIPLPIMSPSTTDFRLLFWIPYEIPEDRLWLSPLESLRMITVWA